MKKLCMLIPIFLTIVLALSIVPSASAQTELFYDDGGPPDGWSSTNLGYYLAVRFSSPPGYSQIKLLSVRYYVGSVLTPFNVHVFDSDGSTHLFGPLGVTPTTGISWFDIDLSTNNIIVTGDFWVAIEYTTAFQPQIGADSTDPDLRSYQGQPGSWNAPIGANFDFMIRAVVEEIGHPVGGIYAPTDRLSILTPYFALVGLIGAISTIFAIKRWRKD